MSEADKLEGAFGVSEMAISATLFCTSETFEEEGPAVDWGGGARACRGMGRGNVGNVGLELISQRLPISLVDSIAPTGHL